MIDLDVIRDEEVEEFYKAYYRAFPELTAYTGPIFDSWTDFGSRVSFDKDLQPFVGTSLGFNPNINGCRAYLPPTALMEKAKRAIQIHLESQVSPIPGGRFFLGTDGIYRKDTAFNPKRIAEWKLRISPSVKARVDEDIRLRMLVEKLRRDNEALKRRVSSQR